MGDFRQIRDLISEPFSILPVGRVSNYLPNRRSYALWRRLHCIEYPRNPEFGATSRVQRLIGADWDQHRWQTVRQGPDHTA